MNSRDFLRYLDSFKPLFEKIWTFIFAINLIQAIMFGTCKARSLKLPKNANRIVTLFFISNLFIVCIVLYSVHVYIFERIFFIFRYLISIILKSAISVFIIII